MTTADFGDRATAADDVSLVAFSARHLPGALRLSQDMRWPYRIEDWAFALQLGEGFVLERDGEVIATAAWFPYGEDCATMGMIIVSGAAQGRGYGARLMDRLLAAAGSRTVLLNSTPEGQLLYTRRGFRPAGTIYQHQGTSAGRFEALPLDLVRPLSPSDIEAVARLDAEATGLQRRPLLDRLLEVGDAHVLLRQGGVAGYAISRPFGRGHVVGPVIAPTADDARRLIEAALSRLGGRFVRIDTAADTGLSPWLESIGLSRVSDALTMVRGTMPPSGPSRVFALSNQSLN
ncbi:GNAT family N-acetyltransferase [Bradyrhizobium sp. SRS-191]|uniref:GNAT family N-acetyltransferase n=1 Tax=Bradyrhizobium sp. SRS-191 TaxID=2962606 RepID=UPI00211EFFD9|nr:GNAT family N-acetyltransferase [Bradyrhizobium sp. SRS-191]